MAIEVIKDPRTGNEMTIIKGKVTGVFLNELKTTRTYSGGFTPTHTIKLVVDGKEYIGLGLTDKKENPRAKDKNDKYHTIDVGMEVDVEVQVEHNGKYTNYNALPKNVIILDTSVEKKEQSTSTNKTYSKKSNYKKDNSGVETGHALNGAMNLLGGKMTDPEEYLELAKKVHDITVKVKAKHKENNPDLDDYSVGASAGNAVLNACTLLTKTKVDQVEEKALSFLEKFSAPMLEYVKNSGKEESSKSSVVEEEHQNLSDDDIPFN